MFWSSLYLFIVTVIVSMSLYVEAKPHYSGDIDNTNRSIDSYRTAKSSDGIDQEKNGKSLALATLEKLSPIIPFYDIIEQKLQSRKRPASQKQKRPLYANQKNMLTTSKDRRPFAESANRKPQKSPQIGLNLGQPEVGTISEISIKIDADINIKIKHSKPPTEESSYTTSAPNALDDYEEEANVQYIPYTTRNCNCGHPSKNRIVGGHETDIETHPWIVQLVSTQGKSDRQYCGGSIINDRYVLTAAHCVLDTDPKDLYVMTGHNGPEDKGEPAYIDKIIVHGKYSWSTIESYDIAVLKLKNVLNFSNRTLPICMPDDRDLNGESAIVAGWGTTSAGGSKSPILKETTVTITNYQTCLQESAYSELDLNEAVLCARENHTDSCQGDSGGPLIYQNGASSQVGIVSWGFGCAEEEFPGIYTKVSHYLNWIYYHTQDAAYCQKIETMEEEIVPELELTTTPSTEALSDSTTTGVESTSRPTTLLAPIDGSTSNTEVPSQNVSGTITTKRRIETLSNDSLESKESIEDSSEKKILKKKNF